MLITIIALQSLWCAWHARARQRSLLAQMTLRELADIGLTDAERQIEVDAPFWQAIFAGYRRNASLAKSRRARSRKAVSRLSRIEKRRLHSVSSLGSDAVR